MGFGSNFGVTWLPAENQRVTFTYRSQVQITYEGDFSIEGADAGDFETTIKFPNSIGLGYGIQLTDAIQVEALLEWLEWSVNDTQTLIAGPLPPSPVVNDWDDTVTIGIGGSWAASDALVIRAGYAFLPTPIPAGTMTPLLPDTDRHALSLGLGYTVGQHTVDLAYTYSIYDDRDTPLGSYEVDSDLIGMTYSMSF